jgi:hypothetical protein
MRQTGNPHGRKGCVIDHVVGVACGGPDSPSNMQWQTKAEAKTAGSGVTVCTASGHSGERTKSAS